MESTQSIHTVRATVRYVGTSFSGWQVQPDQRTVQGEIESALAQISGAPVRINGAGRTDAGVHAAAQVCSFPWPAEKDLERLRRSLSKMLTPDIRFTAIARAPDNFHARKSAIGKKYWYTFSTASEDDPFIAPFAWTIPQSVDIAYLQTLLPRFVGTRDFAGFQSSGAEKESTVRTIFTIDFAPGGLIGAADANDTFHLQFHGNGFLYKMVRNITGTLIDVARGHLQESRIDALFSCGGPYRGFTAPAHGLTLYEVMY